jgi:opacity protein-like surface antigen
MSKNLFVFLFALIISAAGYAQVSPDEQPPIDVFAGYSHSSNFNTGLSGWILSGNYNLGTSWIGVEGDISGHYGSQNLNALPILFPGTPTKVTSNLYNYNFGPRVTWRSPSQPINAFGHLLFGGSHAGLSAGGVSDNDNAFSWVLGGGADYNFSPNWAGRAQLDLLHTKFFDNGESHPRFSIGLVFRFGAVR